MKPQSISVTRYRVLMLFLVLTVPGLPVMAQDTNNDNKIEELVIVAHPLSAEGLSQASDVLTGRELEQKVAENIGATLEREPGIHSAQFGNAVGRPVIHGLGGPRVRIMEDRIDTLDVSVTSADHAVTVEPFIAERVEVLKGSSTLLYGSGAIGGVVDVHTGRIPHSVPEKISGGIETRYNENTSGQTTAAKISGGANQFAWHLDGTWKDGDNYRIPDFAESAALRAAEEEEEGEEGEEEEEEARRRLPGSDFDSSSVAGGVSLIQDWGFVGISISHIDADYGLPGGHGHEEGEEEEEEEEEGNPVLDMNQTRADFELGIADPFGAFTSFNLRLGINDYEHEEIEPSGEVGTEFSNEAWELRGELVYEADAWRGVVGVQHTAREFSALGEEAFVRPVDSRDTGIFWLAERDLGNLSLEGGLRFGKVDHDPSFGRDQSFNTFAVSLGLVMPLTPEWQFSLLADVSSRAPVAEELYSNGPHLVTQAFEVGDENLDEEQASALSATLQYQSERVQARVTAYYTEFSDFIYEGATGEIEDDLPVFLFQQEDATFWGLDAEVSYTVATWDQGKFSIHALFDTVEADLDISGNDNIPRLPPSRFGAGFEAQMGPAVASVTYTRVQEQNDAAAFEFPSDRYEDLRAQLSINQPVAFGEVSVFINGRNLTNDEQRLHTSFIKEFAPAPGRTVEFGLRMKF